MTPLLWYLVTLSPFVVLVPLTWRFRHAPRTRRPVDLLAVLLLALTASGLAVLTDIPNFHAITPIGVCSLLVYRAAQAQRRLENAGASSTANQALQEVDQDPR